MVHCRLEHINIKPEQYLHINNWYCERVTSLQQHTTLVLSLAILLLKLSEVFVGVSSIQSNIILL